MEQGPGYAHISIFQVSLFHFAGMNLGFLHVHVGGCQDDNIFDYDTECIYIFLCLSLKIGSKGPSSPSLSALPSN